MELTIAFPFNWHDVGVFVAGMVAGVVLFLTLLGMYLGPHPFGRGWR